MASGCRINSHRKAAAAREVLPGFEIGRLVAMCRRDDQDNLVDLRGAGESGGIEHSGSGFDVAKRWIITAAHRHRRCCQESIVRASAERPAAAGTSGRGKDSGDDSGSSRTDQNWTAVNHAELTALACHKKLMPAAVVGGIATAASILWMSGASRSRVGNSVRPIGTCACASRSLVKVHSGSSAAPCRLENPADDT
jgi:hypothetical protein